jgi:hypothetical protein
LAHVLYILELLVKPLRKTLNSKISLLRGISSGSFSSGSSGSLLSSASGGGFGGSGSGGFGGSNFSGCNSGSFDSEHLRGGYSKSSKERHIKTP